MPKVSVIIPVHNVEGYLRHCLDSVVNQSLTDIEIICVDDGSTDGCPAILAEYAAKDKRVKIISREHTNAGTARNAGLAVARGEFIGFVDADDFCDLSLFEKTYNEGIKTDSDIVLLRFKQYNTETGSCEAEHFFPMSQLALPRPFPPEALGDALLAPLTHAPWARIVRRRLIEKEGLRFQSIERTNDVLFCCLAMATSERISLVNEPLYFYRKEHGGNLQANNDKSPTLVFTTWRAVADGLAARNLLKPLRKSFFAASANSFFYILGTMTSHQSAQLFYNKLRELYESDELFASVTSDDILVAQTKHYFTLLKECDSFVAFLTRQNVYLKKRVVAEIWARVKSERNAAELKKRESALRRKIADMTRRLSSKDAKIAELLGSHSYKIGRALIWPARKLRLAWERRSK